MPIALKSRALTGQDHTLEESRESLSEAIALILEDRRKDALRGIPKD